MPGRAADPTRPLREPNFRAEANPNVAARLTERAAIDPDRIAIVQYRRRRALRITFGELAGRVAALGAGLRASGLSVGDRVLVFVPMSIDLYALLLGCFHIGATAVFMDAWADRRRLDAAVRVAQPKLFVGTPRAQLLRLLSPAVRRIPEQWVAGRGWLGLPRYERRESADPPIVVQPDDPALITFTTGSTGRPKAAARSHGFLWAQHRALADHLRLRPNEVDMPTLPVFVLNNLALGIPSVLPDFDPRHPARIDAEQIVGQMRTEGVTTSSGSPAFYERLASWSEAQHYPLPLRALWTGGAPVPPSLARRLSRTIEGGTAHVVYGSTEAEPIAGITAAEMLEAAAAPEARGICVGRPVPDLALRLIRPHDGPVELGADGWVSWEVGAGEVGEVVVAGAHVLGEYYDAPEETRLHKIRDRARVWHRTGDAARIDPTGRLWLMGRIRERITRVGETWWGTPVELAVLAVPGITHAAYLGIPDPELGERAVLFVEAASGVLDAAALERVRAAAHPAPVDEVRVLRRIPRDPRHASKTDAASLRRLAGG